MINSAKAHLPVCWLETVTWQIQKKEWHTQYFYEEFLKLPRRAHFFFTNICIRRRKIFPLAVSQIQGLYLQVYFGDFKVRIRFPYIAASEGCFKWLWGLWIYVFSECVYVCDRCRTWTNSCPNLVKTSWTLSTDRLIRYQVERWEKKNRLFSF